MLASRYVALSLDLLLNLQGFLPHYSHYWLHSSANCFLSDLSAPGFLSMFPNGFGKFCALRNVQRRENRCCGVCLPPASFQTLGHVHGLDFVPHDVVSESSPSNTWHSSCGAFSLHLKSDNDFLLFQIPECLISTWYYCFFNLSYLYKQPSIKIVFITFILYVVLRRP